MGRWGDGEMGRWGDGGKYLLTPFLRQWTIALELNEKPTTFAR
ncbi:MAG: hypothetical protein SW833_26085 [Cyanobacteriota bacterium]|nr:hypothetical protein [Cyanobacteriota bacterium]